jgi:hypothetical protein
MCVINAVNMAAAQLQHHWNNPPVVAPKQLLLGAACTLLPVQFSDSPLQTLYTVHQTHSSWLSILATPAPYCCPLVLCAACSLRPTWPLCPRS